MFEPQTTRFWQAASQSGLVDAAALQACWDSIPVEKRTAEHIDRRMARAAIQNGFLTLWQGQQLLAGRSTGFLIGRYVLLDLIGQGGMGRVYLAKDSRLNRRVAIKILSPDRINNVRAIARFQREARVGAQLQHENLVRIYDEGESNGKCYLVMEYIDGKTIGAMIGEGGPMPWPMAARLTRQVALGLEHAQQKGLIHRDVNPYNILVTRDGVAKLTDLGLAIDLAETNNVTRDGATVGTFDYVSPEQARHSHSVDTRSDIYSLGCTIYHMIAGRVPFPCVGLAEKLYAHQMSDPEPLASVVPGTPEELSRVVAKMMRKSPDERFASPQELALALEAFDHDYDTPASLSRSLDETDERRPEFQPATAVTHITRTPRPHKPAGSDETVILPSPKTPPTPPLAVPPAQVPLFSDLAASHAALGNAPPTAAEPIPFFPDLTAGSAANSNETPATTPPKPAKSSKKSPEHPPKPAPVATQPPPPTPAEPEINVAAILQTPTPRGESDTPDFAALFGISADAADGAASVNVVKPAARAAFDLGVNVAPAHASTPQPAPPVSKTRRTEPAPSANGDSTPAPAPEPAKTAPAPAPALPLRLRALVEALRTRLNFESNAKYYMIGGGAAALLIVVGVVLAIVMKRGTSPVPTVETARSDVAPNAGSERKTTSAKAGGASAIPTEVLEGKAFAVHTADGEMLLEADLKSACQRAIGGKGYVEFANAAPLVLKGKDAVLAIGGGRLTWRAAAGTRPVIEVEPSADAAFLTTRTDAPLVLEGVAIVAKYQAAPAGKPRPALIEAGAGVTLDRCSFRVEGSVAGSRAVTVEGSNTAAAGCWFEGFDQAIDVGLFQGGAVKLTQCMFVRGKADDAPIGWALRTRMMAGGGRSKTPRSVVFDRCTVQGHGVLDIVGFSPEAPLKASLTQTAALVDTVLAWEPSKPEVELDKASLLWTGVDNLYDVEGDNWMVASSNGGAGLPDGPIDLRGWSSRMNERDTEPPPLKFAVKPENLSQTPTPQDFAVTNSTLRPRGADPKYVGPGAERAPTR